MGHRVIKVYVKNPKKELSELSDLLVSAGSMTSFELGEIFAVFFVIVLMSQLASRELSKEISSGKCEGLTEWPRFKKCRQFFNKKNGQRAVKQY